MTTAFDTEMAELAVEMVAEFGTSATFYVTAFGVYDPDTLTVTGEATSEHVSLVSPPSDYREDFKLMDNPSATALQIIVPATNIEFTPELGMRVTVTQHNTDSNIMHIHRLASGDDVAAYVLSLKS